MVINASDQITIDVGGRIFKTSKTTLENARYFQSLLGNTGIGASGINNTNSEQQSSSAPPPFIDRDPDLFDEVLYFLRSNELRARTKLNPTKLVDLQRESEFFSFDEMTKACKKAIQALKEALKPPDEDPPAICCALKISEGSPKAILLEEGHVAFVVSATLTGSCQVNRYNDDDESNNSSKEIPGCYLKTCEVGDSGDFQLQAKLNDKNICLAHVGMDHIHVGNKPLNMDFRQDLRMCLRHQDPGSKEPLKFRCKGSGTWDVIVWVGKPDRIPGLQQLQERPRKRRRFDMTADDDDDEDEELTSSLNIIALGLIAGLF